MRAKLFFSKERRGCGKHVSLALIVLLMSIPLLTACSATGSSTTSGSATSSTFGGITQLKMLDANNGWAITDSAVLKTTDGGQQWTDVTPTDWETTQSQSNSGDPNAQKNKEISAAFFLDADNAWIVSSNAAAVEDQMLGTAMASSDDATPNVQSQVQVYVRATIDGGKTWMDAHQIQVTNLALISPPYFIDQHEGWLLLTTTSGDGTSHDAHIYHSTDGGITWNEASTVTGTDESDNPAGLTMAANCTSQCTTSPISSVQGCTTTGTTDTLGWLGHINKQSLLLQQSLDSGSTWSDLGWNTPGGAPGQADDSLIVASPPTMFSDGTGVLPVQMQSNPDGNDPSNFYLHLYKMSFSGGNGASETDLSSTSPFVSDIVATSHSLSAPDLKHIFVIGMELNNGTAASTNLYEWDGSSWQTLSSQISGSNSSSGSNLSSLATGGTGLSNLDFISDTEGWATSDTALYHITLNGSSATWTKVYPAANTTGTVTVPRSPGQVASAPANPPACSSSGNNGGGSKATSKSNSGLPANTLTGYWQDFTNGATAMRLSDVNSNYDLIAVAFASADSTKPGAVTFSIDSGLSGALGGYTTAQFTSDVAALHAKGKKVIISVGGQNGTVSVNDATSATNFANSVADLMTTYGFDGVDIDFENGLNPTYMASALQQLAQKKSGLIITLAPQTVDMQSTSGQYFQLALKIKDILTIVNMQYYNSGTMNGCDGKVYAEGSVDFLTAQACIQIEGGLSPSQVGLGLPASTSAAGSGYVSPSVVKAALACLAQGTDCGSFKPPTTYPTIRGAMTWSINWDAANNYDFANTVK